MDPKTEQDDFVKLISAHQGIIIKICHSYCFNKNDREDLAQEIVLTLWKGKRAYNPDFTFSTWMYKVALNVAISFYRSTKKRKGIIPFGDTHFEIEDQMFGPVDPEENMNLLQKHVASLPELDRALIILYFTFLAIWLYRNISFKNVDKKWFRLLFKSNEWVSVVQAMDYLKEIEEFKNG